MSGARRDLATMGLFTGLTSEQLATVAELGETVKWQAGEPIYAQGDTGSSMFVVGEGAVEIFRVVSGVEKLFMTVRAGDVFGLLSILDRGTRPGSARAAEATSALVMDAKALDRLLVEQPTTGAKVLQGICRVLGERVRLLTEQYDAAVAWNLEVTGLASLNLERLMSERVEITVETVRGEPLRGTLLRFESSVAGHELYLESPDRQIHVVPYHAIVRLSLDRSDAEDRGDTPNF